MTWWCSPAKANLPSQPVEVTANEARTTSAHLQRGEADTWPVQSLRIGIHQTAEPTREADAYDGLMDAAHLRFQRDICHQDKVDSC